MLTHHDELDPMKEIMVLFRNNITICQQWESRTYGNMGKKLQRNICERNDLKQ